MLVKKKFIDKFIAHIRKVQDYMIFLENNRDKLPFLIKEWELIRRGMQHDLKKFSDGFVRDYIKITNYRLNDNCKTPPDNIYECCERHSLSEKHHIKYHIKKGTIPSNLDICEMCCDWTACADRDGTDNTKFFLDELIKNVSFCKEREGDFLQILKLLKTYK